MKSVLLVMLAIALPLSAGTVSIAAFQDQSAPQAEACKTDEGIVTSVVQDLSGTVTTIKKESLDDFEKQFHQQACMSKLSICLEMVQELVNCLGKAAHDSGAAKAQVDACKAKQESYGKLKAVLQQDLDELKAVKDPKTAKADIEKFDFSH